jgi:hypothetical protein
MQKPDRNRKLDRFEQRGGAREASRVLLRRPLVSAPVSRLPYRQLGRPLPAPRVALPKPGRVHRLPTPKRATTLHLVAFNREIPAPREDAPKPKLRLVEPRAVAPALEQPSPRRRPSRAAARRRASELLLVVSIGAVGLAALATSIGQLVYGISW